MNAIVIIEDDENQLEMLKDILSEEFPVPVLGFTSAEEFFNFTPPQNVVYIIDWILPGAMLGVDVVKSIRQKDKLSSIIMVTGHHEPKNVIEGLKVGADDFLFKPFMYDILVTKIDAFMNRKKELMANALTYGVRLISEAGMVVKNGQHVNLTEREFHVFKCLHENINQTKSRNTMLPDFEERKLTERYIDLLVHELRKKVEPIGFEIECVRGSGYRMVQA